MGAAPCERREVTSPSIEIVRTNEHFIGRFKAMACPCEVLIETAEASLAERATTIASQCAWRIEHKFSRYRNDNIVHRINTANGAPTVVDDETAKLIDFADTLTRVSGGRFDLTSGVLRRAWTFDGGDQVPNQSTIDGLLQHAGCTRSVGVVPSCRYSRRCRSTSAVSARSTLSIRQHT